MADSVGENVKSRHCQFHLEENASAKQTGKPDIDFARLELKIVVCLLL